MAIDKLNNKVLNFLNGEYNKKDIIVKDIIKLELIDNDYYKVECNVLDIIKGVGVIDSTDNFIIQKDLIK